MNILAALQRVDGNNTYYFVLPDQPEYRGLHLEQGGQEVYYYRRRLGHLGRWMFDAFMLKRFARRFRPDVVWGMGNLALANPPCPQAISIQNPNLFYDVRHTGPLTPVDRLRLFFLLRSFRQTLARTDLVFCQTATMEQRVKSVYGYRGRTQVVTKVVSAFSAAGSANGNLPAPLASHAGAYKLFYLTRYYAHKGLEILVEVMDRYREELSDTVAVITIEPGQHKNAARLLDRIQERGLTDRIINVGALGQKQLAAYYAACDCLVMPTRLESFSGTYLEAMHFGLPILTSDLDFAREVCGDAALYFDPWKPESIRDSILSLRNDPQLRGRLVEKGRLRLAEGFGKTWEDIAGELKKGLESLVS
jgi:glycosyltransferase involved in cell wall biosynthesis